MHIIKFCAINHTLKEYTFIELYNQYCIDKRIFFEKTDWTSTDFIDYTNVNSINRAVTDNFTFLGIIPLFHLPIIESCKNNVEFQSLLLYIDEIIDYY